MKNLIIGAALLLSLAVTPIALSQVSPDSLPKVIEHAEPIYPPLARQTRISGDVRVKLTTDGGSVTIAEAIDGHPLLRTAAEQNVRTWKFAPHTPATFFVTFRYKLASSQTDVEFLEPAPVVRIEGTTAQISILYASLYLGTWDAHLTSSLGKFHRSLELSTTGPNDWVDAKFVDNKTASQKDEDDNEDNAEASDYGYKEGDFIAFTVKLKLSRNRQMPTFFVGKINDERITGTFLTEAGISGKWTAVLVSKTPRTR